MNTVLIVGPSVRRGEKSWDAIVAPGFNGGHRRRHQGRITTTNFPSESGERVNLTLLLLS